MSTQGNKLKAIADAIREKEGSTGTIVADDFADRIKAIQTGTDTSDATATAADILSPKTAYVKGSKVTGTIASKEAADVTVSGATVSIPAGNYKNAVSKSVTTVTHPAPTQGVMLGTYAIIRASHVQAAGYVSAGTTTADYNVTRYTGGTYAPSTSAYQALPAGFVYLNNALNIGANTSSLSTMNVSVYCNNLSDIDVYYTGYNGYINKINVSQNNSVSLSCASASPIIFTLPGILEPSSITGLTQYGYLIAGNVVSSSNMSSGRKILQIRLYSVQSSGASIRF